MKLLIMNGDTVANVIEVDPDNIPPAFADYPEAPDGVGVGMVWDGSNFTPPPVEEPTTEEMLENLRAERNALLAASDWTQLPDAPADQEAWAAYRQELRDVPQQAEFPENVVWPTKPE